MLGEPDSSYSKVKHALKRNGGINIQTDVDLGCLGVLREIRVETACGLEDVEEWEELVMAVDRGASATVIGNHMVEAVSATPPDPILCTMSQMAPI